jgi:hypothetical protein
MNTAQKTCFKCNEVKPLSEFYRHSQMRDRHLNKCKECTKHDVSTNYRKNIEHYKDYERSRAMLPNRVEARRAYSRTPGGLAAHAAARRRYAENNPLKRKAHHIVGNAIRDGRLLKQPCEVCGLVAQAHHDDYSKPLDVRWLCVKHHAEWHRHNTPICLQQEVA